MHESGRCLEPVPLIEYLYGELPDQDRERAEAHLAVCQACAAEIASLRGVREHLAVWTPPEQSPGFRLVPEARSGRRWLPAMGLAAAAVLVLAAGAALANLEIRYGAEGLLVRTGWAEAPVSPAPVSTEPGPAPWEADFVALEERVQDVLSTAQARPATSTPPVDEAALLRRAEALITASEGRQQRELALRMAQLSRDVDGQRRSDLIRIEQGLGQLEGMTGAEVARQREILNYLVRVSQQR